MKFPRIVVSRRAAGAGEKEALLMVRSIWRKAVFGALASTGLALGQQAAPPAAPTADPACRYVTVAEMGKPGQRCKVLAEWRMADGSLARQVESVDTGERMTIV